MDLPIQGRRYNWRNLISASCIDRGQVNTVVADLWHFLSLKAVLRRLSDHNPILLCTEIDQDWSLKPSKSLDY